MPYKSNSQRRYFHAAEARGEMSPRVVKEFDQASKGKKLPEKVKHAAYGGVMKENFAKGLMKMKEAERRKKMWRGGLVADELAVETKDTSGEPHTNDRDTDKSPMEYEAEESIKDFGIDSKSDHAGYKKQPQPSEPEHEVDPNFVHKMFKGGRVGESNYPVKGAPDEEDFYFSGDEHPGHSNYKVSGAQEEHELINKHQEDEEGFGRKNYAYGGRVGDSNYEVDHEGKDEVNPYQEEEPMDHGDKEDEEFHGYAMGGRIKPSLSFAMHLKKKMRGY